MLISKVAKRYAQGLLDFTQESNTTETMLSEMKDVEKIMDSSKDLNRFFATPFIDGRQKISTAKEIFKSLSPTAQNLITLVIRQGREKHLQAIAKQFINRVEDMQGVQRITLTSAVALSEQTIQQIFSRTSLVKPDQKFQLETIINPEILGGYIIRVGDQQVDASIKTKLSNVRKELQLN